MEYKIIIALIILIIICNLSHNAEKYYNISGNFVDGPFSESSDKKCRKLCNNMKKCSNYTFNPVSGDCFIYDKNGKSIYPYSDHILYPYYDDYLYNQGWWLFGSSWLNSYLFSIGYRGNKYGGPSVHHY